MVRSGEGPNRPAASNKSRVNNQLVERIEVGERDVKITADAIDRSKYLGDGKLAGHQDIVAIKSRAPGRNCRALAFNDGKLHNRG